MSKGVIFINGNHRIAIIDNHLSFARGIQRLLTINNPMLEVEIFPNASAALKEIHLFEPDLLIFELLNDSSEEHPFLIELVDSLVGVKKTILSSTITEKNVLFTCQLGVQGYLPKSISLQILTEAIETILNGKTYFHPQASGYLVKEVISKQPTSIGKEVGTIPHNLSKREFQVLSLMALGLSNYEIGHKLFISEGTVAKYVSVIFKKLDVSARTEAVVKALTKGWIQLDQSRKEKLACH